MLSWAITFFILALIAASFGFGGIARGRVSASARFFSSALSSLQWRRRVQPSFSEGDRDMKVVALSLALAGVAMLQLGCDLTPRSEPSQRAEETEGSNEESAARRMNEEVEKLGQDVDRAFASLARRLESAGNALDDETQQWGRGVQQELQELKKGWQELEKDASAASAEQRQEIREAQRAIARDMKQAERAVQEAGTAVARETRETVSAALQSVEDSMQEAREKLDE